MTSWLHDYHSGPEDVMTKISSLGLASMLVLSMGISERAHGADSDFCTVFKQYFADRALGFMAERDERTGSNPNIWSTKQSFPEMQCTVGEWNVQCKYIEPGIMDEYTIARHKAIAVKIDACLAAIPGLQKTQVKRAHDTETSDTKFYLSEGWEVEDSGGTYSISLIRSGLVLIYVEKH
jgi:hypothetical protein